MAKKIKSTWGNLDLGFANDEMMAGWEAKGFDLEEFFIPEGLSADDVIVNPDDEDEDEHECRYHRPIYKPIRHKCIRYEHAETLAQDMGEVKDGDKIDVLLSGKFIMGDFIEAYFVENNLHATRLLICTLSFNENNVDSLKNLLDGGYVDRIDLICSHYFYAHNRSTLVRYAYQELDDPETDRFQLAIASTHTKTYQWELDDGTKVIMHGSSNMRSSGSIEQMCIEASAETYDFYAELNDDILSQYSTIRKGNKYRGRWYEMRCDK